MICRIFGGHLSVCHIPIGGKCSRRRRQPLQFSSTAPDLRLSRSSPVYCRYSTIKRGIVRFIDSTFHPLVAFRSFTIIMHLHTEASSYDTRDTHSAHCMYENDKNRCVRVHRRCSSYFSLLFTFADRTIDPIVRSPIVRLLR